MGFCAAANASWLGLFGPSNYNECVLRYLHGNGNSLAAAVVAKACRDKFPSPSTQGEPSNVDFDDCVLKHVPGKTGNLSVALTVNACRGEYPGKQAYGHPKLITPQQPAPVAPQAPTQTPSTQVTQSQEKPDLTAAQIPQQRHFQELSRRVYNGAMGLTPDEKPMCKYKAVMTNDDYRRCGLTPPT